MKKLSLTILIAIFSLCNYAQETVAKPIYDTDEVLDICLERTEDDGNKLNIIFRNLTDDAVVLFTQFKNFRSEQPFASGFRLIGYINKEPIVLEWSENSKQSYTLNDGKTTIEPNSVLTMPIDTPLEMDTNHSQELGVEMEIRYRYKIKGQNILHNMLIKTDYICNKDTSWGERQGAE